MKGVPILVLSFFSVALTFFCSCRRSSENLNPPDSTALFTLVGSATACSNVAIGGTLSKNIPLTDENVLNLQVEVEKIGYWSIYTDTVNGVYFTGDSSFSNVGRQTIHLQGYGTPRDTGNFQFQFYAKNNQCGFMLRVDARHYIDTVRRPVHGTYFTYSYNNKNQLALIMPSHFWIGEAKTFAYLPNGRLSNVHYNYFDAGITNTGDSLVYDSENKVQIIINRNEWDGGSSVIGADTLKYNAQSLLITRVGTDLRVDFTYDADSNLVEAVKYLYNASTGEFEPSEKYTYGNYDKNKNPFYNIAGAHLYFRNLYCFSVNTFDIDNYSQLSKNNPGLVTRFIYGADRKWFADEGQSLSYTYDTEGFPIKVVNGWHDYVMRFGYSFR